MIISLGLENVQQLPQQNVHAKHYACANNADENMALEIRQNADGRVAGSMSMIL
jgi:hypothetical protein